MAHRFKTTRRDRKERHRSTVQMVLTLIAHGWKYSTDWQIGARKRRRALLKRAKNCKLSIFTPTEPKL